MSRILSVLGAWPVARRREMVAAELRVRIHDAVAVELPGHGDDKTPLGAISHPGYRDRVATVIATSKESAMTAGPGKA
jgi:hypothetical protein